MTQGTGVTCKTVTRPTHTYCLHPLHSPGGHSQVRCPLHPLPPLHPQHGCLNTMSPPSPELQGDETTFPCMFLSREAARLIMSFNCNAVYSSQPVRTAQPAVPPPPSCWRADWSRDGEDSCWRWGRTDAGGGEDRCWRWRRTGAGGAGGQMLSNQHALLDPLPLGMNITSWLVMTICGEGDLLHLQAQAGHLLLQAVPRSLHQDSPPHCQGSQGGSQLLH